MTIYARSDVMAVTHPDTGETFVRTDPCEFAIDSDPEHERILLETYPDLYARTADAVPPTADLLESLPEHERLHAVRLHEDRRAAAAVLAETRGRSNRSLPERSE